MWPQEMCLSVSVCFCPQLQWETLSLGFLAHPYTIPQVFLAENYDVRVLMRGM